MNIINLFNIDTLYVYFDFTNYDDLISKYLELLENKKQQAIERTREYNNSETIVNLGSIYFSIFPNGTKFHSYILQNDDFKIYLCAYRSRNKNNFPVKVEISQRRLWSCSFKDTYNFIVTYLSNILDRPIDEKISRVDLCCHTDEIDFSIYDYKKNFKTRTRKIHLDTSDYKINCFEIGSRESLIYCRIYNKSLEIKEKNKQWFQDIWQKNGVKNDCDVWNVEFELKRDFLNECETSINTVSDLLENINSIWQYLTCDWLSLIESDRTRKENCTINKEWQHLSTVCTFDYNKKFIRQKKIKQADNNVLISQIRGYLSSYAANHNCNDLSSAIGLLAAELFENDVTNDNKFSSIVDNKIKLRNEWGSM